MMTEPQDAMKITTPFGPRHRRRRCSRMSRLRRRRPECACAADAAVARDSRRRDLDREIERMRPITEVSGLTVCSINLMQRRFPVGRIAEGSLMLLP